MGRLGVVADPDTWQQLNAQIEEPQFISYVVGDFAFFRCRAVIAFQTPSFVDERKHWQTTFLPSKALSKHVHLLTQDRHRTLRSAFSLGITGVHTTHCSSLPHIITVKPLLGYYPNDSWRIDHCALVIRQFYPSLLSDAVHSSARMILAAGRSSLSRDTTYWNRACASRKGVTRSRPR